LYETRYPPWRQGELPFETRSAKSFSLSRVSLAPSDGQGLVCLIFILFLPCLRVIIIVEPLLSGVVTASKLDRVVVDPSEICDNLTRYSWLALHLLPDLVGRMSLSS
jgi:hypothetical protein